MKKASEGETGVRDEGVQGMEEEVEDDRRVRCPVERVPRAFGLFTPSSHSRDYPQRWWI